MIVVTNNELGGTMNKGKSFITETLTADEISDLIDTLENTQAPRVTDSSIARNLAGFILMYRAGLRRKEVSDLELSCVYFDERVIHIKHGKGNKERRISMDPKAFAFIERWVAIRGKEDGPLIQGFGKNGVLTGNRVHESYWNKIMENLASRTGIGKRCNPHSLRHTMANEMRQEGVSTWLIMKQLGHSNIQTTERYLDHLSPKELIDTMEQREW